MSSKKTTPTLISIDKERDTADLYHKMIDEVEDYAIIFLNREGIIQNWNKGAEKIKRYTESEAKGKHFSIFYLPEDRAINLPERLLAERSEERRVGKECSERRMPMK